jgi:hypothetical protein
MKPVAEKMIKRIMVTIPAKAWYQQYTKYLKTLISIGHVTLLGVSA